MRRVTLITLLVFLVGLVSAQDRQRVWLEDGKLQVVITPDSLRVQLNLANDRIIQIAGPLQGLGRFTDLQQDGKQTSWRYADTGLTVHARLADGKLAINFRASKIGDFTWPTLAPEREVKGWILPLFEGVYVPATDTNWITHLKETGPANTTADLGMPFWGWDCGDFIVTWIATNQFNNEITFGSDAGRLTTQFKHEFTRNNPVKEFGFVIQVSEKASPIEPARIYRDWLQQRGEFVSMKQKIQRTPEAGKLLGASHIYLWGDEIISADDLRDWKAFAKALKSQGESDKASPARDVWLAMKPDVCKVIGDIEKADWVDRYMKSQVVAELNRHLEANDGSRTPAEICRRNSQRLAEAFPGLLNPPESWGNGISPKMISRLADAGLARLWLGVDGWDGLIRRPETVGLAKKQGYLIGPYDSYHSIHSPHATDTWETAQFDQALYDTGGIVRADGTKRKGFKQVGYVLSPAAARPYVEKRVNGLMKSFHANSWFMDCDGFGEYFDDYSEAHPATQQSDLQARCGRMAWIRDTYGAVIGSEGCSAGVASTIHFAHGVMTPVIGWGDPDLKDKSSQYFLGAYYPPDGPAVFLKPVPTKQKYRYLYFDLRFRLPLFETVFHDSVVATHHWSAASGKFSDQAATVELLELLYNVPSLYHLNLDELAKRTAQIKRHHDFFSPLHRETGLLPLTEFEWLTSDRLVQRTLFGDMVEMVANFGTTEFTFQKSAVPARSVLAKHRDTGKILIFSPNESK